MHKGFTTRACSSFNTCHDFFSASYEPVTLGKSPNEGEPHFPHLKWGDTTFAAMIRSYEVYRSLSPAPDTAYFLCQ